MLASYRLQYHLVDINFANHFAHEWIESWNSHGMGRTLSHYSDEFERYSPVIIQILGESSGAIKDKDPVGEYWRKALKFIPDFKFELISSLVGVNIITLYCMGVKGLSAEIFHFNLDRKINKSYAHYE